MRYMFSTFNLRPEASIEDFGRALETFARHMRALDLIESTGALTSRCDDSILDTDERRQRFCFVTTFRDADQSRRAIEHLTAQREQSHHALHAMLADAVFSFWEDAPARCAQ